MVKGGMVRWKNGVARAGKEWIWVGKMWAKTRMNGRNDISMQLKGCTVLKMSRASSTFQHGSGGEARNW